MSNWLSRKVGEVERTYGIEFFNSKKWTVPVVISLMIATVSYGSFIDSLLVATLGYVGGVFVIIVLAILGLLEVLFHQPLDKDSPPGPAS